ncbi:amino acid transporter [Fulvitalea axinellae]|uniref:Amino acid transporter n=1 Tax=Fulvitalea axinellae TaxID=1182444 RepID=A0AAU9CA13_9BACT|nr:amino acid transporter [Fulvitalea axinellae]
MQELNELLGQIDSMIGGSSWFIWALLGTGIFFTLYLGFPQLRFFAHAIRIVRGKYDRSDDVGDTSHFQALATALSGTVGTGNIAGVALAVHWGGPSALFWMLVTAFLGMTTKFVEVTLSHKYREQAEDGSMAGGPMYYMKNKLNMKWLAAAFAVFTVISSFGTGSLPQINSISNSMATTFQTNETIFGYNFTMVSTGFVLAIFLALVIVGGIKRIAKVTEKLVPAMSIIYLIGALAVIFYNAENIIPSFTAIFADVFTGSSATGGFLGASLAFAINRGVTRGLFSNEAGQGSAPIAHASAKGHEPVSEGMVAILEPFIDTIVICTITGLVLLSSGVWNEKHHNTFQRADLQILSGKYSDTSTEHQQQLAKHLSKETPLPLFNGQIRTENGVAQDANVTVINARSVAEEITFHRDGQPLTEAIAIKDGLPVDATVLVKGKSLVHSAPLTAIAFTRGFFGEYGKYIVTIGLLLFAFSTAISWSYYGDRAMTYLFGSKSVIYYRIVYVVAFFLAAFTDTTIIWTFSGIAIALMTLPNLLGMLLLHKDMKGTLKEYWANFDKEYPQETRKEVEEKA